MLRTDLAIEQVTQKMQSEAVERLPGVRQIEKDEGGIHLTTVVIEDEQGAKAVGKPVGHYVTAQFPSFGAAAENTPEQVDAVADALRGMLPRDGCCLVVGLGNADITPDALGPQAMSLIFPTRHLAGNIQIQGLEHLRPVSALAPGVLGQTGMETGEVVAAVVAQTQPTCVIAIDALAAAGAEHLGRTVQLSDTGISPGSAVQNRRQELSARTLGVPVIAMGVPTVCDARRQASDEPLMVTPRDIDRLIHRAAKLLALAANRALQPELSVEELTMLVN